MSTILKVIGWRALSIILAVLTIAVVVLFFWLRSRGAKIRGMEAALRVAKTNTDLKVLDAKKEALVKKDGDHSTKIKDLEGKIAGVQEKRRAAKTTGLKAKGLTDDDVDKELAALGF